MSDYFADSYFGKAYFGPNYFGPQQESEGDRDRPGEPSENFVDDYRQTGTRVGNVLYLDPYAEVIRKRKAAMRVAAKRAVAKKALRSAVKRIAQSKEFEDVVRYIEQLEAA